ncbi:uncharacterized protein [Triticum aestivum]|uniref:uncharacterized protein n=1 Tax=Triticum aestivum TaxID=4565 RepID=UPI001D00F008|nr:uncharacterized protein LOC123056757 [Triticum aestivum]
MVAAASAAPARGRRGLSSHLSVQPPQRLFLFISEGGIECGRLVLSFPPRSTQEELERQSWSTAPSLLAGPYIRRLVAWIRPSQPGTPKNASCRRAPPPSRPALPRRPTTPGLPRHRRTATAAGWAAGASEMVDGETAPPLMQLETLLALGLDQRMAENALVNSKVT